MIKQNYKKSIQPTNSKGQYHGYQQWYNSHVDGDDTLWFRVMYKNNQPIGYFESFKTHRTIYYIR